MYCCSPGIGTSSPSVSLDVNGSAKVAGDITVTGTGNITAAGTIMGGNITLFTSLCERTRDEAFELMLQHARQMGANAVIGVRYDATDVMDGVTEVLCYGTAVVVERSA